MYLKYNEKAAEKKVYVIGSCGFDSIPADMGVLYTRDKLKGDLFNVTKKTCRLWFLIVFLKQQYFVSTHNPTCLADLYRKQIERFIVLLSISCITFGVASYNLQNG